MLLLSTCRELCASLDRAEEILSKQRFIAGSRFTEADLRLFVTLIRFDEVSISEVALLQILLCPLKRVFLSQWQVAYIQHIILPRLHTDLRE